MHTVEYLDAAPTPTPEHLARIAQLEEGIQSAIKAREDSWERSDTDGFLSQWAHDMTAQLNRQKITILQNGGYASFPVLCDSEGKVIAVRVYEFKDKFAPDFTNAVVRRWKLPDELQNTYGRRWVPTGSSSRIQKRMGLHEETRWFPAYAKLHSNGKQTGLAGCASAFVRVFKVGE